MQVLEQALDEVKALHEKVFGSPAPTLSGLPDVAFPPGVDPIRLALDEVRVLKEAWQRAGMGPRIPSWRPPADCYARDGEFLVYDAFNESGTWKVWGFNEGTDAYDYNGGTGVALGAAPANKAVRFDGVIYAPLGSSGYTRITGSAGTPTCTNVAGAADPTSASPTSAPRPLAFCIFQQKLWAVTAEGGIAYHTIVQKDAGANAWTWPVGPTSTTDFPHIEAGATPLASEQGEGCPRAHAGAAGGRVVAKS